jgi:hypothetical protein
MWRKILTNIAAACCVAFSVWVAVLISRYPPPETLSQLFGDASPRSEQALWGLNICNGVQCRGCSFKCFLPEGNLGRCKVIINSGGQLKDVRYDKPETGVPEPAQQPAAPANAAPQETKQ